MAKKRAHHSNKVKTWDEARRRFRLSPMHVQMAREIGMDPRSLGKLDNHHQEPWKAPLPDFIAKLYAKRFGKQVPNGFEPGGKVASAKAARSMGKALSTEEFAALEMASPYPIEEPLVPEAPYCWDDSAMDDDRIEDGT